MRNVLLWSVTALLLSSACKGGSQDSTDDEGETVQTTRTEASKEATKKKAGDIYGFAQLCTIATEVDQDPSIPKARKLAVLEKRADDELSKVALFGRASTAFFATMARSLGPEDAYEIVQKSAKEVGLDWRCEPYARLRALQPHDGPLPNPDEPAASARPASPAAPAGRTSQ